MDEVIVKAALMAEQRGETRWLTSRVYPLLSGRVGAQGVCDEVRAEADRATRGWVSRPRLFALTAAIRGFLGLSPLLLGGGMTSSGDGEKC